MLPCMHQVLGTLTRPGETDYVTLHDAYLDGVTASLNSLEHIWAPIDALCDGLTIAG